MTTQFVPPAISLTIDVSYDVDNMTMLEAIEALAIDLDSINYRVMDPSGPAGGWPEVRFVGSMLDMFDLALRYCCYDSKAAGELLDVG